MQGLKVPMHYEAYENLRTPPFCIDLTESEYLKLLDLNEMNALRNAQ